MTKMEKRELTKKQSGHSWWLHLQTNAQTWVSDAHFVPFRHATSICPQRHSGAALLLLSFSDENEDPPVKGLPVGAAKVSDGDGREWIKFAQAEWKTATENIREFSILSWKFRGIKEAVKNCFLSGKVAASSAAPTKKERYRARQFSI